MKQSRSSVKSLLNRTVLGIALASLFSDWSHEIATAVLPAFLGSLGVAAAWLGIIEGVSDGLSSFAKLGSGFYTDRLPGSPKTTPVACWLAPDVRSYPRIASGARVPSAA